jgi:hypothetical protein
VAFVDGEQPERSQSSPVAVASALPARPWDELLLERQDAGSLVTIARDRRLVLEDSRGPRWVDLCWVDEAALALIDLAVDKGEGLALVYPAPAGEVGVLLAAQLLLHRFVRHMPSPSVGLVTGDTTRAARTWDALRIATTGGREPITEVFPCFRAGPDGESPLGGRRFQGVIVGQRCTGWPVDVLVVDHLSGFVSVSGARAGVEVFADPLDRALEHAENDGRLVWGWSETELERWNQDLDVRRDFTVPFSVAGDRLATIAQGIDVTVSVSRHPDAEAAVARAREDLRLLRTMHGSRDDRHVERGLSTAWHHLATLTSLPCRPTEFDRFAGIPPWAVRATRTFEPELATWADTLTGDAREIASILASDIGDLRAALDAGNPFEHELDKARDGDTETVVVTRSRTASRALLHTLGADPDAPSTGRLTVQSVRRLHREGTWPRALVIGDPPPWDWNRLLSGLSGHVEVLVLGDEGARSCAAMVSAVRDARERWGAPDVRGRTWRRLLGTEPPPSGNTQPRRRDPLVVIDGTEYVAEPDPFDLFSSLFDLDPLDLAGEGPTSGIACETDDGRWSASVPAIEVTTDHGRILLELGHPVEMRAGPKIEDRLPEKLEPGDVLLVGRRAGRVGLLEALEERLGRRSDLVAARYLVDDYRRRVRARWAESGSTFAALHRAMTELGCDKTSHAVRSWITEGTMAPQHLDDLERLNIALQLAMSATQVRELFAGVQRRRGFRRAAGRALAAAASHATVVADDTRIDSETGLSIADLRDAVVEATVVSVTPCDGPVPMTLLGMLGDT